MKKKVCLLAVVFLGWGFIGLAIAANLAPQKGDLLPALSLPIPKHPGEKAYLGLSGNGLFKVHQLKAEVVIIEIFNMYCPYCQKEAPLVNELYQAIEENPDLKGKVKIIGIGAGNSPFEVGVFKKTYAIPFPLFADQEFLLHKMFGEVGTPFFMALKMKEGRPPLVIYSKLGRLPGAKPFLDMVLMLAEMK